MERSNQAAAKAKIKVVFIAGAGRSGSTLLGQLLGQVDHWFAAGELFFLWDRLLENSNCGCEQSISCCPIWRQVAKEFSSLSEADIRNLIEARDSRKVRPQGLAGGEIRLGNLWRRLAGKQKFHKLEQVQHLSRHLGRAFQAIAEVTGAKVIVDSSKSAAHGFVLQHVPNIELHEVHIVRNPKAVAFSWRKKNKVYDVLDGQTRYFPQRKIYECTADWIWSNMSAESLLSGPMKLQYYQRIRYEDLIKSSGQAIQKIVDKVDANAIFDFINPDGTVNMRNNHMMAGNPSRFSTGVTRLKIDEEWRYRLPWHKKLMISAASFPLMVRYGYY